MRFPKLDFSFDGVLASDLGLVAAKDVCLHPAAPNTTWAQPDYGDPVDTSRFVAGHMTYGLVDDEYATFWLTAEDFDGRQEAFRWLVANLHGRDVAMTCSLYTAPDGHALEWYGVCSVEDVSDDPATLDKVKVAWQRRPYRMLPDGEHAVEFPAAWDIDAAAASFAITDGREVTSAAPMLGMLWLTCPDGTLWSTRDGSSAVQQAASPMGPGVRLAADGELAVLWSREGAWWSRDMRAWQPIAGAPAPILSACVAEGTVALAGEGGSRFSRDLSHWADAPADNMPFPGATAACSHKGAYIFALEAEGGTLVLASRDGLRTFSESVLPVRVCSMCSAPSGVVAIGEGRSFVTSDLVSWTEGSEVGDAHTVVAFGDRVVAVGTSWAMSEAASTSADEHLPIERTAVFLFDTVMPSAVTVECNYEMEVSYGGQTAALPVGGATLPWALGHGRHEIALTVPYQPGVWAPLAEEPRGFPAGAWWRYRQLSSRPVGWADFGAPQEGCPWLVLQNRELVEVAELVAVPPWGMFPAFEACDDFCEVPSIGAAFREGVFYERQDRVRVAFRWERGEL